MANKTKIDFQSCNLKSCGMRWGVSSNKAENTTHLHSRSPLMTFRLWWFPKVFITPKHNLQLKRDHITKRYVHSLSVIFCFQHGSTLLRNTANGKNYDQNRKKGKKSLQKNWYRNYLHITSNQNFQLQVLQINLEMTC